MKYIHFDDKDDRINILKESSDSNVSSDSNDSNESNESNESASYDTLDEKHYVFELEDILRECHINCHYKGYEILIDAARIIYHSNFEHVLITKEVYDVLADSYETNSSQVEHAIRTAITYGWEKYQESNKKSRRSEIFSDFDRRPTNNHFINYVSRLAIRRMRLV